MSFISLPTGKLQKKAETKKLKNFPTGCLGRFYRNLADNVDSSLCSDFCGRITNDCNQLFFQRKRDNINHYVTYDRIKSASFRPKIDPIAKNTLRIQNPLELVFQDILTFDAQNPIVGSLLRELDVGKKT